MFGAKVQELMLGLLCKVKELVQGDGDSDIGDGCCPEYIVLSSQGLLVKTYGGGMGQDLEPAFW